jgi:hypothetical protein
VRTFHPVPNDVPRLLSALYRATAKSLNPPAVLYPATTTFSSACMATPRATSVRPEQSVVTTSPVPKDQVASVRIDECPIFLFPLLVGSSVLLPLSVTTYCVVLHGLLQATFVFSNHNFYLHDNLPKCPLSPINPIFVAIVDRLSRFRSS